MNADSHFGLQKLTLLDYPGKVACTIFLHGCNFRCPFCHNASLVVVPEEDSAMITFNELKDFLSKRGKILDGACITGGEPMLRPDLADLLELLRSYKLMIKLDTNGSFPDRLKDVIERRLVDAVAMDVKNTYAKYDETTGVTGMADRVKESAACLKSAPLDYYELRTTVVRQFHTVDDLTEIAREHAGAPHYFLQKFKDSGDLLGAGLSAMPDDEMARALEAVRKFIPNAQLRGVDTAESPETNS